ncbi:MAG: fatty acyl-AMP ligase, partial [Planctomycetales bacterium]|nr:fatty acyl-AMP ligase [Planctomycetales bacterium]
MSLNLDSLLAPFSPPSTNFVDRLRYWAEAIPDELAFIYLVDGEQEEIRWTYADLDARARRIGAKLVAMGLRGQRALLLYPPGLEFVAAFFGCHYAGAIPVPAYPPRRNRNMGRIQAISEDADAKAALTVREVVDRVDGLLDDSPSLKSIPWLATEEIPEELSGDWVPPDIRPDDIALLQYTSGSTGSPKGVVLTHANLLANCALITHAFEISHDLGCGVSWLPTYHDMGLVGGILNPAYVGIKVVLMSPMAFMAKPLRWLQAISRYRAQISGGPNFAYQLCVDRISPEDCESLDLSSWRVAFNGAEPVRAQTLEAFANKFEPCGFDYTAHYPCYGMAETTLIVTGAYRDEPPVVRYFHGPKLDQQKLEAVKDGSEFARPMVGCGRVLPGERVVIVNPETLREAKPEQVGEIWVQSPSVGCGYWNKPVPTHETFQARLASDPDAGDFLRTGDLGFMSRGELFVAGRLKDLIIVRGVNRYPQDIEATVEASNDGLRNSCSAAFAIEHEGAERLIVVCEVERGKRNDWNEV